MYYCLWTTVTVHVFVSSVSEIKVYIYIKKYIPMNVPRKKGMIGTLMMGDTMLMNQLGNSGVVRRNMM